jgi:uncharacterized protein (TIGR02246 family)
VAKVPDTEPLQDLLDRWKAAIDAQRPDEVAELFTDDAVFQGLRPYSVGRQGVSTYYSTQPPGMTVTYRILETRRLTDEALLGYVKADFSFPQRPTIQTHLGIVAKHFQDGWRITYYQASKS